MYSWAISPASTLSLLYSYLMFTLVKYFITRQGALLLGLSKTLSTISRVLVLCTALLPPLSHHHCDLTVWIWVCGGVGTYMKVRSDFSPSTQYEMGLLVAAMCARSMNPPVPSCLALGMLEMRCPGASVLSGGLNSGQYLHDKGFTHWTLSPATNVLVGCGEIAIFGSSAQENQQERWALTQTVLDKQTWKPT